MEDELDTSPHPSKRQKTTAVPNSSNNAFTSRVLKTVKQAVYGKHPKPEKNTSSPSVTPRKQAVNGTPRSWSRGGGVEDMGASEDELANKAFSQIASPTKSPSSARRIGAARVQIATGAGTVGNTTKAPDANPGKKRRKKYQGWHYLEEDEDVGVNNQDAFAKIAEEAAKEAARAEATGKDKAAVSAKSLRERKSVASLECVSREGEKAEPVKKIGRKRKEEQEKKTRSTKGNRDDRDEDADKKSVQTEDSFDDELQIEEQDRKDVVSVRVKIPKRYQSTPKKKKDGHLIAEHEEVQNPSEQPESSEDDEDILSTPKKDLPHNNVAKRLATNSFTGSPSATKLQRQVSVSASQKALSAAAPILERLLSEHPDALMQIKAQILGQLTSQIRLPILPSLSKQYEEVHKLLRQTVTAGEGNSMLMIGSRGSGKTALVESAIYELMESNKGDFHVVRLNGSIHTDDKLALREIWRQLGKELEDTDQELGLRSNYADTLTSLLALLSHQDESQEEGEKQTSAASSVIFILDEFDLFAQHSRQTLLYNLFDVAQSHRNAPIAVLGLTTKVNVVDGLEKRVKSRYSQRQIHLSLPQSICAYSDICLEALTYHTSSLSNTTYANRWQPHQCEDLSSRLGLGLLTKELPRELVIAWNNYTRNLLSTPHLTAALCRYHATTNRPVDFQTQIALPLICSLTPSTLTSVCQPTPSHYNPLAPSDSTLTLLATLSAIQLSLLIAACRLDLKLDTDIVSFDMAYEEYVQLASRSKVQSSASGQLATGAGVRVFSPDVARKAWEGLAHVGLVVPATGGGSGARGRDGLWRADVSFEEVRDWLEGEGKGLPGTHGLAKWCKEV